MFGNPSNVDIKSVTIEHQETSHKLSKCIRQVEQVYQVGSGKISSSPLFSKTKTGKIFE